MEPELPEIPEELTQETLDDWSDEVKEYLGLWLFSLSVFRDSSIKLHNIIVCPDEIKQGKGTISMNMLIELADVHQRIIWLTPATKDKRHKTTSRARLIRFYRRFGFVLNKGRNKDFRHIDMMYRKPISRNNPYEIPKKPNGRPALNFYGESRPGSFPAHYIETEDYLFGNERRAFDWEMITGMTARNGGKFYHVSGAVEQNPYFISTLGNIARRYPEILDYLIDFDGPPQIVRDILQTYSADIPRWEEITFLHGTSTALLPQIMEQGLLPRSMTGMPATHGAHISSAAPGHPDAIYLTTQLGTASWAARDAVALHGGEKAILQIRGINGQYVIPDIDSRETTARRSLYALGAIGYLDIIPPAWIQV